MKFFIKGYWILFFLNISLGATEINSSSPGVCLGPEILIGKSIYQNTTFITGVSVFSKQIRVTSGNFQALIDKDDQVHVLLSLIDKKIYMTINLEGTVKKSVVKDYGFGGGTGYTNDEMALDQEGIIHVFSQSVDYFTWYYEHYVQSGDQWEVSPESIMEFAKTSPQWSEGDNGKIPFINSCKGEEILHGYIMSAKKKREQSSNRSIWHIKPGYVGISPSPPKPNKISNKLLILRESSIGGSRGTVIDVEDKSAIVDFLIEADKNGTLNVLYFIDTLRKNGTRKINVAFAKLTPEETVNNDIEIAVTQKRVPLTSPIMYPVFEGMELPITRVTGNLTGDYQGIRVYDEIPSYDMAVDQDSGIVMIANIPSQRPIELGPIQPSPAIVRTIIDGTIGDPVQLGKDVFQIKIAPAGKGNFHALLLHKNDEKVIYMKYHDGVWSKPIEVGIGNLLNGLVSSNEGKVLAIWNYKREMKARWIESIH